MSTWRDRTRGTLAGVLIDVSLWAFVVHIAYARGGGGGSSSGGGEGILLVPVIIYVWYVRKQKIKKTRDTISK